MSSSSSKAHGSVPTCRAYLSCLYSSQAESQLGSVRLVFQLVEFAQNLTALLSEHHGDVLTSFPKTPDRGLSEAEWAARRAAFENENGEIEFEEDVTGLMSPEDVRDEARRWDEAMLERRSMRV